MSQNLSNKTCKTCRGSLQIRQTRRTPEQLLKQYYYTAYYFCPRCNKMYLDDSFKVVNKNYSLFTTPELPLDHTFDIEIWTDGACANNGQVNAKAAWAFVTKGFEASGLVEGKQTNNTAEAFAILEALVWAAKNKYKTIKILSDSQISIHNLLKPASMIKANKEIFEAIEKVVQENALQVVYEKVAGHAGIEMNERVDKLANKLAGI